MPIRGLISRFFRSRLSGFGKSGFAIPDVDTATMSAFEIADWIGNSVADAMKPGMNSRAFESAVDAFFARHGLSGYFRGYNGYPSSISLSRNEEALGRPASRRVVLQDGDLAKFETGVIKDSQCAYVGWTFPVGNISKERRALLHGAQLALDEGCRQVRGGGSTSAITAAIDRSLRASGLRGSRDFVGCRIGHRPHMPPRIPASLGTGVPSSILEEGISVTILVIAHSGDPTVYVRPDGFTIVSRDGADSVLQSKMLTLTADEAVMQTHPKCEYGVS